MRVPYTATRAHHTFALPVYGIAVITDSQPLRVKQVLAQGWMRNYPQPFSGPTLYAGVTESSVSESPSDSVGREATLTDRTDRNPSSVLNSIPLTSGDRSDRGHYCAEIITLELRVVSVSGGLPHRVATRREGTQTKRLGL